MTTEEAIQLRYMQEIYYLDGNHWLPFQVLRYNEDTNEVEGTYWEDFSPRGRMSQMPGSYPLDKLSLAKP